jgi:hypothetical protein
MSQLETAKNQIFSQPFTLVAGVGAVVNPANFGATSRLLSIVRIGLQAGVVGTPKCRVVPPSAVNSSVWGLGIFSSVNTDDAIYEVFWTNQYVASPSYAQAGVGVGVQYSP